MTGEIAVGVPMYSRVGALRRFLESVPGDVSTVYVAENGPREDRDRPLYREGWPFDLEVLELEHDVGIGACRREIERAVTERYLWIGDNDMRFTAPGDLRRLREILEADDELGGVSGWLLELGVVRSGAYDLERHGRTLLKTSHRPELTEAPVPHAEFDFIPQAGLFRSAVFDSKPHDARFKEREHADFFLAHAELGRWNWASTPAVTTLHDKTIDEQYRERRGRHRSEAAKLLARKWGVERVVPAGVDWAHRDDRTPAEAAFSAFRKLTPASVWLPVRAAVGGE